MIKTLELWITQFRFETPLLVILDTWLYGPGL